jgi:glutathionyl-hydroquinone reductase
MLYHKFDDILPEQYKKIDLFPDALQAEIEAYNEWIYNDINNGVYKSGFATTQEAYEKAVTTLFSSLDKVEAHLAKQQAASKPYFFGDEITEADIRLYTTIVRFDPVYVQHFKCNLRDIRSGFPALHRWVRRLYWDVPAFRDTTLSILSSIILRVTSRLISLLLLLWGLCQISFLRMRRLGLCKRLNKGLIQERVVRFATWAV